MRAALGCHSGAMTRSYRTRRVAGGAVLAGAAALALVGCGARDLPVAGPAEDRATASVAAGATQQLGDVAPHEQENNGWRQRATLTTADQQVATTAATRIRSALERLRTAGDFRPESTRGALVGLGFSPEDVQVRAFRKPAALPSDAPEPTGVVYGVRVGDRGCVYGDVAPQRAMAEVGGPVAEWGCIEPEPAH